MPTRQQGGGENWRGGPQPVQKAENSCVFTTAETQRSIDAFLFFPPSDRLPTLHLPFPSQPCGHKESSISVNRIKCSIDPVSHSILQDTFSNGLNKAPKTPKPDHLGPIPLLFAQEVTSVKDSNDMGGVVTPTRGPFGSYFPKTLNLTRQNFKIDMFYVQMDAKLSQ